MTVSKHAIERLRERFSFTKDWSEEVAVYRIVDAFKQASMEDCKSDGSVVWIGLMQRSVVSTIWVRMVVREGTIVSVY